MTTQRKPVSVRLQSTQITKTHALNVCLQFILHIHQNPHYPVPYYPALWVNQINWFQCSEISRPYAPNFGPVSQVLKKK